MSCHKLESTPLNMLGCISLFFLYSVGAVDSSNTTGSHTSGLQASVSALQGPYLVVFGDSLSDTGNLYAITDGGTPPSSYYYDGRFSNGPIYLDRFDPGFGRPMSVLAPKVINYATGGATTCAYTDHHTGNPQDVQRSSLGQQVERFLVREVPPKDVNQMYQKGLETVLRGLVPATPPVARKAADPPYNPQPTAQVLVMMGSNDYLRLLTHASLKEIDILQTLQTTPSLVVNCTMQALRKLINATYTPPDPLRSPRSTAPPPGTINTVLVSNVPPVEVTPMVTLTAPPALRAALQQAVQVHNSLLQQAVRQLDADQENGAPRVRYFDLYTATLQIRNAAAAAGVADITNPCIKNGLAIPAIKYLLEKAMEVPAAGAAAAQNSVRNTSSSAASPPIQHGTSTEHHDADEEKHTVSTNPTNVTNAAAEHASSFGSTSFSNPDANNTTAYGPLNVSSIGTNGTGNSTSYDDPPTRRHATNPDQVDLAVIFNTISGVCDNPDDYYMYDAVHPTSKTHSMMASPIRRALESAIHGMEPGNGMGP